MAVEQELRDVADVGGVEAVVLEDDPSPGFLEGLVGGREGHEVGPVLAAGGDGGGLDVAALGGGDFLDELGNAAVFFDDGFGGGVGEAVAEKEDVVARADKKAAAKSSGRSRNLMNAIGTFSMAGGGGQEWRERRGLSDRFLRVYHAKP